MSWQVDHWFNTPSPLTLEGLRGKVVVLHAFQMLCPACVSHGLPQAQRIRAAFLPDEVAVVGLHTVFEHHAVMQPKAALEAFIHEYRLTFPIGIDRPDPSGGAIPLTMRAYGMRGTPSLLLFDREGRLRAHELGAVPDLTVGTWIGRLLAGSGAGMQQHDTRDDAGQPCETQCAVPLVEQ